MTDATTENITRLCRILKGIDTPYWITRGDNDKVLFKYPDGYKQQLQQRINNLIAEWRRQHPNDILNGGD